MAESHPPATGLRASTTPLRFDEPGIVEYHRAWQQQRAYAAAMTSNDADDTVMLLEHPPVYTAGKRTQVSDRPTDGTPVIDVDRGGRITWHGPGQLVGYPIIRMADPIDVVDYVRLLEQVLITVCARRGIAAGRVPGRSGVWLAADEDRPERKIAAIGVRIAGSVTHHGFALNCCCDLTAFDRIVPCGIRDAGVTSLSAEVGRPVTVADIQPSVKTLLTAALDGNLPVTDAEIPHR